MNTCYNRCCCGTLHVLTVLAITAFPVRAEMRYPLAVVADESAVLYVADRDLPGVWKFESDRLASYFTGSKQFRTPLNAVRSLAIDNDGSLLVGDTSTREIYRFDADGRPTGLTDGGIGIPMGIAVTEAGDLLVSDLELHRIWKVPGKGGRPELLAEVPAPRGVCLDRDGRLLVVSHGKDGPLLRVASDGRITTVVGGRPFEFPHDVAIDPDGTIYVSDGYAKAVWRIREAGKHEKWVSGAPLMNPVGLSWTKDGLLVADPRANAVFAIDATGKVTRVVGQDAAK
jgi:sugar lactone lactonase YvrE